MGFFKDFWNGMKRAQHECGTIEGTITHLKSGHRSINVENGKVVLWVVGEEDIILQKDDIFQISLLRENIVLKGVSYNAYNLTMKNGEQGLMRLKVEKDNTVMPLIMIDNFQKKC